MDCKSYFECKRCFHKFKQKTDVIRHLKKKDLCIRSLESYNYNDDDVYKLSLYRIYNNDINKINENVCEFCKKNYANSASLKRHIENTCKYRDIKNNENIINNITDNSVIDNSVNIINIDNSINIDNNIINNITLNINIINSFDETWNTNHINDAQKLILLLNNSKFTSTLEHILENDENLNVLIDTTSDNALVYNDKHIINMNIKDIVKKTMEKLLEQLSNFKKDIIEPNKYNIDSKVIDQQIKIAENKFTDFSKNSDIQKSVNSFIKDIYSKKKDNIISIYNNIAKDGY
jgi:hypothetical protein